MARVHNTLPGGYTLLEVTIAVAVGGILCAAVAALLSIAAQARAKQRVVYEVESQGAYVLDVMLATARSAAAITAPSAGTSATSVTFAMNDVGVDPTIFALAGDVLTMSEGGGSAVALTGGDIVASGLTFTNVSATDTAGSVRVTFTLAGSATVGKAYVYERTFYGAATLR